MKKERLSSLDTLRGFDMFWIIGGEYVFHELSEHTNSSILDAISHQLHHVKWDGFHAYDLIFPLFMFMAGVAVPYALFSKIEKGEAMTTIYYKVCKRAFILVVFGVIYNGGLNFEFENLRYASVLGQIGIAYLIASLIAVHAKSIKALAFCIVGILILFSVLQLFVPVPGFGAGVLTAEGSINSYIDQQFLPGRLHRVVYDPEGILCAISASAIILMGVLAGVILRSNHYLPYRKIIIFVTIGAACSIVALLLQNTYPIIKSAWTSTFNLLTGGLSFILLALFYMVIDVWKFKKWTFFFRVIGLNSITIYMITRMVDFKFTSEFLFTGVANMFHDFAPLIIIIGMMVLEWLLLYFLYKRSIFLKV